MLGILIFHLGSFAACAGVVQVTSLSTILTGIARDVGADHVRVVELVKPGMDPHTYEPQPEDLRAAGGSQLILASGKHIENYLPKLVESAGGKAEVLPVGDAMPSLQITGEEAGKTGGLDPHWWHSIPNMKIAVRTVRDALSRLDPADKEAFDANAATALARLDTLAQWVRREVATLPRDKRKLVTSHDAFQYFARDYGFTIYPIEGVTPEDEASARKISDLIAAIKSQGVKAVFFENIENPKVVQAITRETGAKVGGELYADGLGVGAEATYDGMVRHNVITIVESLR